MEKTETKTKTSIEPTQPVVKKETQTSHTTEGNPGKADSQTQHPSGAPGGDNAGE
jgi:hypothetical protein